MSNTYFVKPTNSDKITAKVHDRLEKIFSNFEELDEERILHILWLFCFSPEYAWEKNYFPEEDFESSIEIVRRELLRMYKYLQPDGWKELTAALSNDAERELSKKLSTVENAFYLVRRKLLNSEFSTKKDFERVLFLLASEEEKYRFGGLSELHFDKFSANILKEYANEIGKVLAELYNDYPFEEPKLINDSSAEEPKLLDNAPVTEELISITNEVAQAIAAPTPENQLSLILESQDELKELEKLYPIHCQYIKVLDTLLEKGFTKEELTKLIGIN